MARIRTIKPEFWRSPSTGKASAWARLLYIAMWNWADDHGRAEWTPRELLGFAFPHDSESPCTDADFPRLLAEVSKIYHVKFYTSGDRRYYEIPSWSDHQKTEKRAGDRFPHYGDPGTAPDQQILEVEDFPRQAEEKISLEHRNQGNRGTGEQGGQLKVLPMTPIRPEIQDLCEYLATWIVRNGSKRPHITKIWKDECRRMIDIDGHSPDEIHQVIDWCQQDTFWQSNILSMKKLREKYDQLRLKSQQRQHHQIPLSKADQIYLSELNRIKQQPALEIEEPHIDRFRRDA